MILTGLSQHGGALSWLSASCGAGADRGRRGGVSCPHGGAWGGGTRNGRGSGTRGVAPFGLHELCFPPARESLRQGVVPSVKGLRYRSDEQPSGLPLTPPRPAVKPFLPGGKHNSPQYTLPLTLGLADDTRDLLGSPHTRHRTAHNVACYWSGERTMAGGRVERSRPQRKPWLTPREMTQKSGQVRER